MLLEHQLDHAVDPQHRIPRHTRADAIVAQQRLVRPQKNTMPSLTHFM